MEGLAPAFRPGGRAGAWCRRAPAPDYDLPLTHVETLDSVLEIIRREVGLSAIQVGWGDGDENTPRIWLGDLNTTPRLALTGSADPATATPWQDADGNDIVCDGVTAGSVRSASLGIGPDTSDDLVIVQVNQPSAVQVNAFIASYYTGGRGWIARRDGGAVQSLLYGSGATVVVTGGSPTAAKAWQCSCLIVDRIAGLANEISGGVVGPDASLATLGSLGTSLPVTVGYLGTANGSSHRLLVIIQAAGIAAPFKASSFALTKRLTRLLTGIEPRSGSGLGAPSLTRAQATAHIDRNGRHHFLSAGMPRACDSEGFQLDPTVTNYCFEAHNITTGAGWGATGGTLTVNVDDTAAQVAGAEGDVSVWGRTIELANASGTDQYLYNLGPIGVTFACHLLALGRMVAGSGARVGWRDASAGTFADVGALADSYAMTRLQASSPGDTDCAWCCKVPDGCTVRIAVGHAGRGTCAPAVPVPNWATAAAAAKNVDTLTLPQALVRSTPGSVELEVTAPAEWTGNYCALLNLAAVNWLLYLTRNAGSQASGSQDGSGMVQTAAAVVAPETWTKVRHWWDATTRRVRQGAVLASGSYDGSWHSSVITTGQGGGYDCPVRIRNLKFFRRATP